MIRTLSKSIRQYRRESVLAPLYLAVEIIVETIIPLIMAELIDTMTGNQMEPILKLGFSLIGMAFVSLLLGVLSARAASTASTGFAKNLRQNLFYKIQDFAFSDIDYFSSSSLVTRMTTDVSNVQMAFGMFIRIAIRTPLMMIFSIVMAFKIHAEMAWIFVAIIPFITVGLIAIAGYVMPFFRKIFKEYDRMNNSVQENINGIRVVKAFVREDHEIKRFDEQAEEVRRLFTKAEKVLAWNGPIEYFNVMVTPC